MIDSLVPADPPEAFFAFRLLTCPELSGSMFGVPARPGATGCGYGITLTLYGVGFPSPHLDMSGLGQGFKGYNRWILLTLLIKIRHTRHTPLSQIGRIYTLTL